MRGRPPATRRELARDAIAAAAGVTGGLLAPGPALGAALQDPGDAHVLGEVLAVERLVVVAYRQAIASGKLSVHVAARVAQLLAHEREHMHVLSAALARLGARSPRETVSVAAAQRALARAGVPAALDQLRDQHQCLRLLIDVETLAEGTFFGAIAKLRDPVLVRTAAQIMACEAQHWTALSLLQHHGDVTLAVPAPFVHGAAER